MGLGLNINLGLGSQGGGGEMIDPGELPATFTIGAGFANAGTKRIDFSEPVTVTITGDVTLSIGSTEYHSGDTIPVAGLYHELTINPGAEAGTISFGKRKQISYLRLESLGSSVITGDITGMRLTYLRLESLGSSVITGDITGMRLTHLRLASIGSSLSYGTNSLNITVSNGIQLLGDTVFATSQEYARLIQDAANGTWGGKYPFRIDTGTTANCPNWDDVKADVATLLTKAAWTIIPAAWLTTNGGTWRANWYEYTGE